MRHPIVARYTWLIVLLLFAAPQLIQTSVLAAPLAANLTPIYTIQGPGPATPLAEKWVDVVGVVTGVTPAGFYLQDPLGDGDPQTSDGIYVYTQKPPAVQVGQCVQVQRAYVSEFYEKTELSRTKQVLPSDRCPTTTLLPVLISVPRFGASPLESWEAYEGMLVQIENLAGVVQGPTKRFASGEMEIALLPALLAPYVTAGRVFQGDDQFTNTLVHLSSALGAQLPEVAWGDHLTIGSSSFWGRTATGILDYNFGKYQLLLLPGEPVLAARRPPVEEEGVADTADDLTICSLNLYGLGRGAAQFLDEVAYRANLRQRALAIHERLHGCTIIGLQEAGQPQDAENLAAELGSVFGRVYQATSLPGPQSSNPEFPLTNSVLTRRDRVQLLNATARQGCSPIDYEVAAQPGDCLAGQYPLFDRLPLTVDVAVTGAWGEPYRLRLITNHWKSKAGDEAVNLVRREAQARQVAALVQEAILANAQAHVVVLGDLNDYYPSRPVEVLRTSVQPPLLHTYDFLPVLDRYTYIFQGASQVLDHILVTANMAPALASIDLVHINSNFAYPAQVDFTNAHHSSDHDPVQLRIRPTGAAMLGGNLRYGGIQVELLDAHEQAVAATLTDALGDFRFWNLQPGAMTLRWRPPNYVALDSAKMTLSLVPGYNQASAPAVLHQASELGVAAALVAPAFAQSNLVEE